MMSSSGFRPFDELSEHYEDEWLQLGLDDETLKCSSPPTNGTSDFGLSVATRLCPSPLSHIPTREPYLPEPPPKLSPVSAEQQTFITLSNSRIPSVPPAPSQPVLQPTSQGQSSELASIEYELNPDMSVLSIPSSSPVLVTKPVDLQFTQPSVSGLQQNGDFSSFVQLEHREKRTVIQSQQHPPSCVQAVNGQWFVQAQVQHVQTSAGTVIAVVPNFCRPQAHPPVGTVAQSMPQVQVSQSQLIAHSLANVQTVGTAHSAVTATTAQHVLQNHQIQQQQQPQQIVNAARLPSSLTIGVAASSTPQQGHSVMQHLLSQPTISRPHTQGIVHAVNLTSTNVKKQRIAQPRNGRKKNCNQGGTLGAVLAKANKLAAAASTDASLNQLLPPTHGIEMRLSVQNSEQVASLSKEISRLQNIQAVYNIDHSAEIKDLENKRAQIFFEALAQQHKDKDLLSAANPKSMASPSQRQRNHKINHNNAHTTIVVHQVQPSTSSEQQQQQHHPQHQSHSQQPSYETGGSARIPLSYQNSYQMSHYTPPLETLQQNCSFNTRRNNLISQATTAQYSSYRTTVNQPAPAVHHSQVQETYVQTLPNAIQHPAVVMQTERHVPPPSAPPPPPSADPCMITELPCDQTPPPVQLYPPPVLRSSAEAAACIAEKKTERAKKLGDYFAALRRSLEHPDLSSPFHDLSDAFERLIPYHIYLEPDFNSEILNTFDHNCQRHFVHLYNRKNIIEQRLRSLLFKGAMEDFNKTDECLLLSLDSEYERRLLDEEKRMTFVTDKEEFVAKSAICGRVTVEELNRRRKELTPKSMPKLHFDYHAFSEAEVSARVVSPFTDSEDEDTSSKKLTGIDEDVLSDDLNDEAIHLRETTSETAVESSTKPGGSVETICPTEEECLDELFQKNMAESNCVDSSLLLELTPSSKCCDSRRRSDKTERHQNFSPVTVVNPRDQMLAEKNIPSIKSAEQLEAIIALAHAASLERIPSPVTAEENESIENCVPMEDACKISETEITSCDNDSTQNLEHKSVEVEKTKRPPIRIKIALTDVGLKNCMNKSSSKKNREKKKKKRKHCSFVETTYNKEVNGVLPSCSGLVDVKSGDTTSHRDDTSHPRILMRITRKNNVVSVMDSRINQTSVQLAQKGEGEEERAPEPKVPKLKIRLGRNREEHAVEAENLALDCVSNNVMHEVSRLKVNFGDGDCDGHKHAAGMEHGRKMTIVIPKSVVTKSYSSSCNWNSSISEVVSSSAQFSPNSELSDEESHEQLRAQTDNVISRLNDWGNTNRVKPQEDTLSRMVATAPLANSALDRLLPSNSWLLNMDMRNHTTTTDNADSSISSSHMPWLTSTASRMQQTATCSSSRRLKTSFSTTKSHE